MTLQDFFPADLTLYGLQNLYSQVDTDSFLVNSPNMIAKNKILTKRKHYFIFNIPTKDDIKMFEIVLIDLFLYEGYVYLIVRDINTQKVSILHFGLKGQKSDNTKFLVDTNYFTDRMDDRAIRDYCQCDIDKKQPTGKSNPKVADDLLEFNF